jgi:hypothetical protein
MIKISDIQKGVRILRSEGLMPLIRKIPDYLEWRTYKTLEPALKWNFERKYGSGLDVVEEDWDNLILLDCARYDYFKKYTSFDGDLSRVVSRGRGSWEFIRDNFAGREIHDTVYVTANPHPERLEQDVFYTVETVLDRWDPETGTVPPKAVTEAAIEAQEKYPNKRLIVHYMQPHTPHLGQTAQDIDADLTQPGFDKFAGREGVERRKEGEKIFVLFEDDRISRSTLCRSYRENLELVEPHVKQLVSALRGKTVISADHGENLGETIFGITLTAHGSQSKEARFVPWLELPFEERKTVTEESPIGFEYLEEEFVEDRLSDLGYL